MVNSATTRSYEPLLKEQIFSRDNSVLPQPDSLRIDKSRFRDMAAMDSIATLQMREKERVWNQARTLAKNSRNMFSFDESAAKEALNQLYRSKVEWHKKMSLPVSIMIFFLIGAPLGAIIRKGRPGNADRHLGDLLRHLLHHQHLGRKGCARRQLEAFYGMWLSSFILAPIAVYLTYKATNDSVLLDVDWYTGRIKYYKEKWGIHTPKWMSALAAGSNANPKRINKIKYECKLWLRTLFSIRSKRLSRISARAGS